MTPAQQIIASTFHAFGSPEHYPGQRRTTRSRQELTGLVRSVAGIVVDIVQRRALTDVSRLTTGLAGILTSFPAFSTATGFRVKMEDIIVSSLQSGWDTLGSLVGRISAATAQCAEQNVLRYTGRTLVSLSERELEDLVASLIVTAIAALHGHIPRSAVSKADKWHELTSTW
ncbi:MAG: hypothetical protein JNL98_18255 [Bryobacterales bacterium]|nr:hypothetical protein [Bryobacterales bacterium]